MSGGADSLRTAALLMTETGNDVFGIHMRLLPDSRRGRWCARKAIEEREEALKALAGRLGIPMVIVDLREDFEARVIEPFIDAYRQGLTPNPCTLCNPAIKFGLLLDEARRLGADRLATGHYARLSRPDRDPHPGRDFHTGPSLPGTDRFRLLRGADPAKDQSYFLYGLSQEQMASVLFPLGSVMKRETMHWAATSGHGSLIPEESQEICFIPSGSYREFLMERLDLEAFSSRGPIIDMDGVQVGEHRGIFAYTVGQRRGLGIASTAPYYVVEIEPAANVVRVGRAHDLECSELVVHRLNWVSIPPPSGPFPTRARLRNQHTPAPALVIPLEGGEALVRFDLPQRAVTPGQAAVFYDGDLVLGGGIIRHRERQMMNDE